MKEEMHLRSAAVNGRLFSPDLRKASKNRSNTEITF